MNNALAALGLLVAGWLNQAAAQTGAAEAAAPRPLPVCALAPDDPTRLAVEPCRPAPPRQDRARRAVPQAVGRMPPRVAPPLAAAASPSTPSTPLTPSPQSSPLPPLPIIGCDSGGCRDAAGVRHNGGVGNATIDAGGRQCVRNGAWLQCY
ncbi:hypothetical protein ACFDR9_001254 [Janthinobacterium sp. CG_23.3]|uniref:hypothetical protein n=1 Tax=Janthinobacterium sp. CG_23.3 TaxID=3349634 RepID=UPI0038D48F3D